MYRRSTFVVALVVCSLLATDVFAQEDLAPPFATLDKETRDETRWYGGGQSLAELFNAERDRLGERFDAALLDFVGQCDVRHFYCAEFLVDPNSLHGREPRPYLSLLLLEQGLVLCQTKDTWIRPDSRWVLQVPFRFHLAVGYQRVGLTALAARHKQWYEPRRKKEPDPGASDKDWKVYRAIPLPEPRGNGEVPKAGH